MTLQAPFRFDIVGSFLRPDRIKEVRARFARGEIAALDLKQVEDEEIARLIEKQKAAGLHTITDGEFRRSYWHLDFFWGFQGITHIELDHGYQFHGEETMLRPVCHLVVGVQYNIGKCRALRCRSKKISAPRMCQIEPGLDTLH